MVFMVLTKIYEKAFKAGIVVHHNLNGFQIAMRAVFINLFNVTKMDFVGVQQVLEMKYLVLSNILLVRYKYFVIC